MSVYRDIERVVDLMKIFGLPEDEIVETFLNMSPDPFHSAGFISYYTGVDAEVITNILQTDKRFIKIDGFVWTTEKKIESCSEVDKFEKLV